VVLNLGTPGLNSSKLRQQLPGILTSLRPDLLMVMVGVNDLWTAPAPLDGKGETWHYRLWNLSRVYRFLYMLSRIPQSRSDTIGRRGTPAGPLISVADEVELIWTGRLAPGENTGDWRANLQRNLQAIISDAQLLGVDTVLVTYPMDSGWYGAVNGLMRETGARTNTPVVDVGAAFREVCPLQVCPELLLPDQHPTVRGHELVADVLAEHFSATADAPSPSGNAEISNPAEGASP
jgi:lysophospholipase L1-like esterase